MVLDVINFSPRSCLFWVSKLVDHSRVERTPNFVQVYWWYWGVLLVVPFLAWVFATGAASADAIVFNDGSGDGVNLDEHSCKDDIPAELERGCSICKCLVLRCADDILRFEGAFEVLF